MSVGLLVVQLHYGLYVFCHLSILLNAFLFNVYSSVCLKYGLHGLLISTTLQPLRTRDKKPFETKQALF